MNNRPKVGLGVIVIKDDKILLGKRKNAHGEDTWGFPGGHLEFHESWENCAHKEVLEETGLKINTPQFLAVTNDLFIQEQKHYVTIFMFATYQSGELQNLEPHKCEKWIWIEWQNLPQPLFLPIQNLIKTFGSKLDILQNNCKITS